jgi:Ca2+-binding EF-hand superfamily protein
MQKPQRKSNLRKEMLSFDKSWFWLPCMVAISAISIQAVYAQPTSPARSVPAKVGNVPVANVLQRLGAKLERGITTKEFDGYSSHFDRTDPDRDGKHTRVEYVDKGNYMTPQARAGIFRAADGNSDGVVTKAEYILNRIITDEAKAIVQGMDDDKDGLVERAEFVKHAVKLLSDLELAEQVYAALDANADGGIPIPEYLRVWGQWARAGRKSAEERIAERRLVEGKVQPALKNCPACAMGLTAEFVFKRLDLNEDKVVTATEFQRSPGIQDKAKADEAVVRIDKDGNGTLSWDEFETAYKIRHANCKKSDPTAIAANAAKVLLDSRGDGNRFAQVFIMRNDKDGDGLISKSEFRGSDSGFERMDKNKNGFIESDELGELHQMRLADPKSMRERIQSGDIRQPPQGKQPERGAGNSDTSGSERSGRFSPFGPNGIGPGQAGLGRLASSELQIGKPFPSINIVDADGREFSTEQLKGHYTVLVAGCLTCPAFLGSYPSVEAVHRDYASKGVKFYYVYRALAHPENNGIVKPFSLKERLMHIVEARQRLKTQVPWLADNMNNDFKRTTGNTNNSEFVLDPEGRIVHMQMWSNGDRLRVALQKNVWPVAKPTTVAELGIPIFQMRPNTRGAVLPRIEVPGIMIPLKIEPKQNGQPFYVK